MNNKVVVTGGSGFLGSHIADQLTDMGYDVTIFDSKTSPWLKKQQKIVIGDILDQEAVNSCIKGSRFVFHLAGIADIGESSISPVETIQNNILGTTYFLDAAVKASVERFVFASTVYVYSRHGSFYRASKQATETLIEAYHERFDLSYTILRYGSLYGPRSQSWNGLRRYVEEAVNEGRIIFRGTGDERREYIHVVDAAKASVEILSRRGTNSCYTITGSQVLTSRDLLMMIAEIIDSRVQIEYVERDKCNDHYQLTPYKYTPKLSKKMFPSEFIDIGEGILQLVEDVAKRTSIEGEDR